MHQFKEIGEPPNRALQQMAAFKSGVSKCLYTSNVCYLTNNISIAVNELA